MIFAATGHRPNKLGGYSPEASERRQALARWFLGHTRPAKVISGMALGWDTDWALAALSLDIPVIAAIPFFGQESAWPLASRVQFETITSLCEEIVIVCEGSYAPWKMQKRNQWMVDHATHVVALWDGSEGGTANCIRYAADRKPYWNLWWQWSNNAF